MAYTASGARYDGMEYRRCGASGLRLPAISLGTWHNFGDDHPRETAREMLLTAFDHGVTHFDCANNYGPPPGSAEVFVGDVLSGELRAHRDELIISTKAGYPMWPGPYGDWGSKKSLLASLDQSLRRLKLDYVDIFYHHRPDPDTPVEESMEALCQAVRSGRALYVGLSNYAGDQLSRACAALREMGVRPLIHQHRYSLFNRGFEQTAQREVIAEGLGEIFFSPLAKGLLTDRYFGGVPEDSRAASASPFLPRESAQGIYLDVARKLNALARARGETLAQMALAWVLKNPAATSVLIGASRPAQILSDLEALGRPDFSAEERACMEEILRGVPAFR